MKEISIELEGIEGPYEATVTPTDKNGKLRFSVSTQAGKNNIMPGWNIEIEPDCNGWAQTPESILTGPKMPCFLIEEIGEKLEARLK